MTGHVLSVYFFVLGCILTPDSLRVLGNHDIVVYFVYARYDSVVHFRLLPTTWWYKPHMHRMKGKYFRSLDSYNVV